MDDVQCDLCGVAIEDLADCRVPVDRAVRHRPFMREWAEAFDEAYGVLPTHRQLARLAEALGPILLVCPGCRARTEMTADPPATAEPGVPSTDRASQEPTGVLPGEMTAEMCVIALENPRGYEAEQAVETLIQHGEEGVRVVVKWMQSRHRVNVEAAMRVLRAAGPVAAPAAPYVVEVALRGRGEEAASAQAVLVAIGPPTIAAIRPCLHPDVKMAPTDRRLLIRILSQLGPAAVGLLAAQLGTAERLDALEALHHLPDRAVTDFVAPLLSDEARPVRSSAAALLARIGSEDTAPQLIAALADGPPEVRLAAAWGLLRLKAAVPPDVILGGSERPRDDEWVFAALLGATLHDLDKANALLAEAGVPSRLTISATRLRALAQSALESGDAALSRQYAKQRLSTNPLDSAALVVLARASSGLGHWEEAKWAYKRTVALDPFNPRHHFNLGVMEINLGNESAAVEQWRQAARLDAAYEAPIQAIRRVGASAEGPCGACVVHPERTAEAHCARCGISLCRDCWYTDESLQYCARHVPPVPDADRLRAEAVSDSIDAKLPRTRYEFDREASARQNGDGTPRALQGLLSSALGHYSGQLPDQRLRDRERAEMLDELERLTIDAFRALELNAGCERLVWGIQQLSDLWERVDGSVPFPDTLQVTALYACARRDPSNIGARFFTMCEEDAEAALLTHFARAVKSPVDAWHASTERVAVWASVNTDLGLLSQYVTALIEAMPPGAIERAACRAVLKNRGEEAR